MHIPFPALRAFAAVARLGSFTAAAQALHLTQPAISKSVRELETLLETPLLERLPRELRLTDAGNALYEHARAIFALEQAALDDLQARRGLQKGRLAVGASTTIAAFWLPPYLARFAGLHPGIELSLFSGNTAAIAQAVQDGQVDVGLVEGPVSEAPLECTPWRNELLTLVGPPGTPLALSELNALPWIVREQGSGTAQVVDEFLQRTGLSPTRRITVGSNTAIVQMVLSDAGVALVPRIMVEALLQSGELQEIPVPGGTVIRPLNRLTLRERPASAAREAFEALLKR
ncbi:MAG: LysR family transcriptional regulator [Betaproteobacteria bacterium]|nr:LysR family transcriptional regulator [Betaproteobacteria bacterium]